MSRHVFVKRLHLPRSAEEVFAWHERPETLNLLIPPGDPVKVVGRQPGEQGPVGDGAKVVLEVGRWPARMHWVARHEAYVPGRQFVDIQEHGPFRYWKHTHRMIPDDGRGCVLEDRVEYELPLGALGDAVAHERVRNEIERLFAWRHRATFDALVRPELT
jgi:ligand-binding SRPBCC domain-containing protein